MIGTAVVAGAVAWLAIDYTSTPRLGATTPSDNGWVRQSQPQITMHVDNASNLGSYTVDLDGVNVTNQVQRSGDQLTVAGVPLDDGQHTVKLSADASGVFGGHIARTFTFTVDTQAPKLALSQRLNGYVNSNNLSVTGTSDPGARVKIAAGSTTIDATAGSDGSFTTSLNLPDGSYPVSITAIDPAGNTRVHRGELKVDATPPAVTLRAPPKPHHTRPMIAGTVTDTSTVTTKTTLDGAPFKLDTKPSAPLAQGAHVLRVQATDAAGNVTVKHARILVNTSEKLGTNALIAGAVGKDVTQLQHALVTDELLKKGGVTGFFDRHTIAAVKAFQKASALPVDGAVGIYTLGALSGDHDRPVRAPAHAPAVRAPGRVVPGRRRPAGLPDPGRPLHHHQQGREPDLGAASGRAVGAGRGADPARARGTRWGRAGWGSPRPASASTAPTTRPRSATASRTAASACRSPTPSGCSRWSSVGMGVYIHA